MKTEVVTAIEDAATEDLVGQLAGMGVRVSDERDSLLVVLAIRAGIKASLQQLAGE